MTINQLFKKKPQKELVEKVLNIFGLANFDDNKNFTKKDLENIDTLNNMLSIRVLLEEYYLPCKRKVYLDDLTIKKCITILRQLVKLYDYILKSNEKYIKGEKIIIYYIVPVFIKNQNNKTEKNCVISFD